MGWVQTEMLLSRRGIPLAWSCVTNPTSPVVTVELATKWYGIQVVQPDFQIETRWVSV